MNIWIFQTGEPIHIDPGIPRPMRAMNLANTLILSGHSVTLWTSAFYHQEKRHRSFVFNSCRVSETFQIKLIPSPGYSRNIGFGRLIDHAFLARNLKKELLRESEVPDVAFVGYPPIEFAYTAVKWLNSRNIPLILDVKDQWPQIFIEPFPKLLQPLVRIIFSPYYWLGKSAMRGATAFCSMSQSFLHWMERFSGRTLSPIDCVIPLSPMSQEFSQEVICGASDWWASQGVINDGRMRFFFVGSLSQAFDFAPILEAARYAIKLGKNWQFVICGEGAKSSELINAFHGLSNVVLPGWIDRPQVIALAQISIAGLAPYRNTDNFISNMPNKIIDYLSLGKVIISPLKGEVLDLIIRHNVGLFYDSSNGSRLFEVLEFLCGDEQVRLQISKNAITTYKHYFSAEVVYGELVDRLIMLSKNT
jgi:glycosyltransferase involved in cell wall biosynthesis